MVYWRGNSAEHQDTNGKLGPKPYRERYHPGMDEQCGRSGWLAGSRSERCLTNWFLQSSRTANDDLVSSDSPKKFLRNDYSDGHQTATPKDCPETTVFTIVAVVAI